MLGALRQRSHLLVPLWWKLVNCLEGQEEPHPGAAVREERWFITLGLTLATPMARRKQGPWPGGELGVKSPDTSASHPHHTLPKALPRHLLLSGYDRRLGSQGGS